jgi:hypothetical protein
MTVNYAQAEQARNAVLKAYGIYLPEGLVAKVSAANIRDIVQILPRPSTRSISRTCSASSSRVPMSSPLGNLCPTRMLRTRWPHKGAREN